MLPVAVALALPLYPHDFFASRVGVVYRILCSQMVYEVYLRHRTKFDSLFVTSHGRLPVFQGKPLACVAPGRSLFAPIEYTLSFLDLLELQLVDEGRGIEYCRSWKNIPFGQSGVWFSFQPQNSNVPPT